jgi:hypothetical protein
MINYYVRFASDNGHCLMPLETDKIKVITEYEKELFCNYNGEYCFIKK